jgi:hypothetical protein
LNEAVGVVIGDVARVSFDVDHYDSAAATFMFCLI